MPRKTRPDKPDRRGARGRSSMTEMRTPRPKPKIDFTADALDFAKPRRQAPHYPVPPGPFGAPCPNVPLTFSGEWRTVVELARSYGWSI